MGLITASSAAQGIGSLTTIEYDEATNTVTAYSQTVLDYDLVGEYKAQVHLTVRNSAGVIVAYDSWLSPVTGFASIRLSFAGEPGTTYTAVGDHGTHLNQWDYAQAFPHHIEYFDNWYFSSFSSEGIYQPTGYYFQSPGYYQFRQVSEIVHLGSSFASVSTPEPRVTINVPSPVVDGSTANFSVTVQGGTPTGYQWSFTAPTGSGNNPLVDFSTPTATNTTAPAHWFANPNDACLTSDKSTYKVEVTVSFSDRSPISKDKSFEVTVPTTGGRVRANPLPSASVTIAQNASTGMWVVTGISNYAANANNLKTMFLPTTSQFFNKIDTHEEVHMQQWGSTGLFGQYFQQNLFFDRIRNFTDSTQAGLSAQISSEITRFTNDGVTSANSRCNQAEIDAYAISDPLAPMFVYQRCGRTTFTNCAP